MKKWKKPILGIFRRIILKNIKKGDIFSLLLIVGFVIGLLRLGGNGGVATRVEIRVENRVYHYPLDEDRVFVWQSTHGKGKVEIKEGKVRMLEASCRDQLCVKQGWISRKGLAIICMPGRVVVEIVGEDEEKWDGVTE